MHEFSWARREEYRHIKVRRNVDSELTVAIRDMWFRGSAMIAVSEPKRGPGVQKQPIDGRINSSLVTIGEG